VKTICAFNLREALTKGVLSRAFLIRWSREPSAGDQVFPQLVCEIAQLGKQATGWRRLYRVLALGWTGSDREWHALERAMKLMAGTILAVAVSVHSVVAWDFAMAIAPMWHSTIFAPYFVVGAIFSGLAGLILAMTIIRKTMHLERYLTPHHFQNLSKLLLLMSLLWLYFTFAEHLTTWYGNEPKEMSVFNARLRGHFAPEFWIMVFVNFVVPFVLLGIWENYNGKLLKDAAAMLEERPVEKGPVATAPAETKP